MPKSSTIIRKIEAEFITEEVLEGAAKLFNLNYGIWGPLAEENLGPFAKQGARVKMSSRKPTDQILTPGADNIYTRMLIGNELVGNAFATRWVYEGWPMIWITQLCVASKYRNRGIAKQLLEALEQKNSADIGILSSHPFAVMAALRVFGCGIEDVDLETTRCRARAVMESCPVGYVKEAKLRGSLFEGRAKARSRAGLSRAPTRSSGSATRSHLVH